MPVQHNTEITNILPLLWTTKHPYHSMDIFQNNPGYVEEKTQNTPAGNWTIASHYNDQSLKAT